MIAAHSWTATNEEYLAAVLTWLRLRFQQLAHPTKDVDLTHVTSSITAMEGAMSPPSQVILSQRLGLSRFEQSTLLLCIAMELDPGLREHCAQAHGDPMQAYPTFALALSLFDQPAWDILSPERPLRYWRLIEVMQSGTMPLTVSPLRVDERIINYVKGFNYLDDRLSLILTPLDVADSDLSLPDSQQELVDKAVGFLEKFQADTPTGRLPLIQLMGTDSGSMQLVARHIATEFGLEVFYLPLDLIPESNADLDNLARLWQREALLLPIALYIDAQETEEANTRAASLLGRFLKRSNGLFFLGTRDVRQNLRRPSLDLDVKKPLAGEQRAAWSGLLDSLPPQVPAMLAGQFDLALATIHEVATKVLAEPNLAGKETADLLWDACLVRTRPRLDTLAERLEPKATWSDIVLREDLLDLLQQIANQVSHRGRVYDDWGFRQRMNRGLGLMTLFAGESGTGKTMAAEVIANELRLNLYRIDLSAVVSKYIGETEKNLRRLFDAAEGGGAILFFDEADALFGKRSQVKDSHDRYANIETNYLLQRMEAYRGLAILATNMKSGLDDAFTRRLRFIVTFPFPEQADRKRIWRRIFPPELPLDKLNYERLAEFKLTGGSINNAALNAAFLAAKDDLPVNMAHLFSSIRNEFVKADRLMSEDQFV